MKACPVCRRTFEDTLTFCLVDGSVLSAPTSSQTPDFDTAQVSAPPPTEIFNPTTRPGGRKPELSTLVSAQPLPLYSPAQQPKLEAKRAGKPGLIIAVVLGVVLIFTAIAVLISMSMRKDSTADNPADTKAVKTEVRPSGETTAIKEDEKWGATNDKASLSGENLTYYPGTTPEQCQVDCDKNAKCKGFTFIRAGAYNPGDSAMCYQASVVTGMVTHTCCISAIKRE